MENIFTSKDKYNKIVNVAEKLTLLARDTITVRFRFFDVAMSKIRFISKEKCGGIFLGQGEVNYDPELLLINYMKEEGFVVRLYLHILLHSLFLHQFKREELRKDYWDMATDIAVENIILELAVPEAELSNDVMKRETIKILSKRISKLTADKIYKDFLDNPPTSEELDNYRKLFSLDSHLQVSNTQQEMVISKAEWEKITRKVKTELAAFSKNKTNSKSLHENIGEVTKEKYNYREILKGFTVMSEEIIVNDEEFDYVYYTYGLNTYGNMPLVEPLEYREANKIKDFVIAIDTSASCQGDVVKTFLGKTYNILSETESFFTKINLHIIQCDARVRQDTKISCKEDFEEFIKKGKLTGFGGTDFRPVFDYVDELIAKGEFDNLKGLIYFTDGYGIYPERMPKYDVMFAFLSEDANREPVPSWAIKVILEEELNEY